MGLCRLQELEECVLSWLLRNSIPVCFPPSSPELKLFGNCAVLKGPLQQRETERQGMHLPAWPAKVTITRSRAQPGFCFLAEGTRVHITYVTGFLVTKVGVPHTGWIKASRLCCNHFATLNKAQGLQRCLGCKADPSPALRRSTVDGSNLSSCFLSLCPIPPSLANPSSEQPCGHQHHWPASSHLSGLIPRSALSHPMLGPLLGSTHRNIYPACVSTKGHFVISTKQLITKPLMVTSPGISPCLADDVAAASRARHAWEPAEAREESMQTFHLWRGCISSLALTWPLGRFGGDCHHKQCALFSWPVFEWESKSSLLAGWVFFSCFQERKKKRSPRADHDKLGLLHLSSKSSRDIISSSSWYRNNIYLSCSQYRASVAWCMCVCHTYGCLGWRRWVQTWPCNMSLAGTAGHHPR